MVKIIMDSGKKYNVEEENIERILYENSSGLGFSEMKLRTGLVKIPNQSITISPQHISSIEKVDR